MPDGSVQIDSSPFPMPQGALYRLIGYNDIEDTSRTYSESGKTVFAGLFNLEVGESRNVAFSYALPPQVVHREKERLTYSLFLQKQPGTGSIPVEVTIRLPSDYCVRYSIPTVTHLGVDEVRFNVSLDSDSSLELNLERGSDCKYPEYPSSVLVEELPEGRTRTALGSVVISPATEGLKVDHVQVSPQDPTLIPGQRFLFTAVALDSEGRPVTDAQLSWHINNPAAGTISSSGLFIAGPARGHYADAVQISATSPKGTAFANITIEIITQVEAQARFLDSVIIYPAQLTVRPGQIVGLGALGWDSRGRFVQSIQFQWSMADSQAGTIDQFGFFNATQIPGSYPNAIEMMASQDTPQGLRERQTFASVTVSEAARQGVLSQVIVPRSITLTPDQRYVLIARTFDGSGQPVRDVSFAWEVVEPAAGIIGRPGQFIAGRQTGKYPDAIQVVVTQQLPEGTVHVRATIAITVEPPRVVGDLALIQLVPKEVVLKPGQRFVFTAFGLDSDGRAIQGTGEWEVVESDAGSISSAGVFKAGSEPGTYTDTVRFRLVQDKDGQRVAVEAYATVKVVGPLDSVRVARATTSLETGQSAWFFAVGYDASGLEIPFLRLRWSMENPDAGSITPNGLFTADAELGRHEDAIRVTAVELDTS